MAPPDSAASLVPGATFRPGPLSLAGLARGSLAGRSQSGLSPRHSCPRQMKPRRKGPSRCAPAKLGARSARWHRHRLGPEASGWGGSQSSLSRFAPRGALGGTGRSPRWGQKCHRGSVALRDGDRVAFPPRLKVGIVVLNLTGFVRHIRATQRKTGTLLRQRPARPSQDDQRAASCPGASAARAAFGTHSC